MTPLSDLLETAVLVAPSLRTAAAIGFAASVVGVFVILRREALAALALPHATDAFPHLAGVLPERSAHTGQRRSRRRGVKVEGA